MGGAIRRRGGSSSTRTRRRTRQLRILIHETIHALGIGYAEYGRRRAEVIVDTVAFSVVGGLGIDTSGYSIPT